MSKKKRTILSLGMILLLFVVPFLAVTLLSEHLSVLSGSYGYVTAALIGLLTNATFIVPTPTLMPLVVEIAENNSLIWVSCLYAAASAFGETTGYWVGMVGREIPGWKKSRFHKPIEQKMRGNKLRGWLVLFFLAVFPASPFDVGGAIAGDARYPWKWFWVATFLGRWIKYVYLIPTWSIVELKLEESWVKGAAPAVMILTVLLLIMFFERKVVLELLKNAWESRKRGATS